MKIYVIQEINEGVAECPLLFTDEALANDYYIKLVNKVFNKNFKTEEKASDFLRENESFHDIHYWIQTIIKSQLV